MGEANDSPNEGCENFAFPDSTLGSAFLDSHLHLPFGFRFRRADWRRIADSNCRKHLRTSHPSDAAGCHGLP
jgi:hypothetical protein